MNDGPPPLPRSSDSQEASGFAHHAANACVAAPLIIFVLSFCVSTLFHGHQDDSTMPLFIVFGLMATGFSLIGLLLGILAMALARPGQRVSVISRSLIGLALLGLLAAIAVPNFVRARDQALARRKALDNIHSAAADLRVRAASALTNANGAMADTRELRRSLSQAADKSSGESAAILRSSELYLERLQPLQQKFSQATKDLTAAKVLAASTLERQDQIAERKALVKRFLEANDACKEFVANGEFHYSNQLAQAGVSAGQIQAALSGFRKNSAAHRPWVLKIREADGRMGQAMLGVLDLFDTEWGQWKYDTDAQLVRFAGHEVVEHYNALMAEIKQAGAAEAAASKRLAAVMTQRAPADGL